METIAIVSRLSTYLFALLAVILCIVLFRRQRQFGWLLVSVVFIQPFYALLMRAVHGQPLLTYKLVGVAPDGHQTVNVDFPFFYIVAIIGLYLLVQKTRHEHVA
jgi:hypothetical protein